MTGPVGGVGANLPLSGSPRGVIAGPAAPLPPVASEGTERGQPPAAATPLSPALETLLRELLAAGRAPEVLHLLESAPPTEQASEGSALYRAIALLQVAQEDSADALLTQALARWPRSAALHAAAADLAMQRGTVERALVPLGAALDLAGPTPPLVLRCALAWLARDAPRAEALGRELVQRAPDHPAARLWAVVTSGRAPAAWAPVRHLPVPDPSDAAAPALPLSARLPVVLASAAQLLATGAPAHALLLLELPALPAHPAVAVLQAEALVALGRPQDAHDVLAAARSRWPADAPLLAMRTAGLALAATAPRTDAMAAMPRALLAHLGAVLLAPDVGPTVLTSAGRALPTWPRLVAALHLLAAQGDTRGATAVLREALATHPDASTIRTALRAIPLRGDPPDVPRPGLAEQLGLGSRGTSARDLLPVLAHTLVPMELARAEGWVTPLPGAESAHEPSRDAGENPVAAAWALAAALPRATPPALRTGLFWTVLASGVVVGVAAGRPGAALLWGVVLLGGRLAWRTRSRPAFR